MERLIDLIYETVADPSLWPEVTRSLAREVAATAAWMGHLGRIEPVLIASEGFSDKVIENYTQYYAPIDPLVREWKKRPSEMESRVISVFEYVDEREWHGSEIYNDFCIKAGIGDVMTAALLPGAKAQDARFITLFLPPGFFFQGSAIETYDLLLPHLRRAARLRHAVASQLGSVPKWTMALLEQLSCGVFLLDQSGRLVHANAAGRTMLAARDGLLLQAGGRIVAWERAASERLEVVLKTCLAAQPQGAEMAVPRASGGIWLLSACPLSSASSEALGETACRAWLCVSDPAAKKRDIATRLGTLFGLTAAEQRVAAALLEGQSPAEIAAANSVSLPTVRSQIQAIFARVGVRRQAELVRILGEAAALPDGRRE